jgi:uncharacterized protein with HEPN domain
MSKRRDQDYLSDIREAMQRAAAYTVGMTLGQFLKDHKTQDAVVRNLEVIGEATKGLSSPLRNKYPDVPWKGMAGLRDKMIHQYFGVNYDVVWAIIQDELPDLLAQVEDVLAKETQSPP